MVPRRGARDSPGRLVGGGRGRLVGLHLKTEDGPDAHGSALDHGSQLSRPYGMSVLHIGTTWRSSVFDHVEDMSCRRGACCKFQSREGWIEVAEEAEDASW